MDSQNGTLIGETMDDEGNNVTMRDDPMELQFQVLKANVDAFFLIVMGCIVFLMQCGFAFLEAGAVRYVVEGGSSINDVMCLRGRGSAKN